MAGHSKSHEPGSGGTVARWLNEMKVVICAGTGGVGKTTIAAALGYGAAQAGRRVLVLTIDPARRLADALGLKPHAKEQKVTISGKGQLSAAMVDPEFIFNDFVRRVAPKPAMAERLLNNRLFRELATTLNGSQEFTSLERLLVAVESGKFDLVVLDTPPTQHAMDFLRAPERIFSLFQESVTRWFIDPEKQGLFSKLVHTGTRTVIGALERITGSGFLRELSEFFSAAAAIQDRVAERSIAVHRLLARPDSGFVLVTAFDEAKVHEALEFATDLEATGHHLKAVVMNRSLPDWLRPSAMGQNLAAGDEGLQRLVALHDQMSSYFVERERGYDVAWTRLQSKVNLLKVPEEMEPIEGIEGLKRVASHLIKENA
jgi:anion-transporting  ArsA/GET3 family ATPase